MEKMIVPIRIPRLVYPVARLIYRMFLRPSESVIIPNLLGDRDIEYTFLIKNIPNRGGNALDFGSGASYIPLLLARLGYNTIAFDKNQIDPPWYHPNIQVIIEDIVYSSQEWDEKFDVISNISSIEHVGVYGAHSRSEVVQDADLVAMQKLHNWLKPDGIMILTIPVGLDDIFPPMARIYGKERLPRLLSGYNILKKEYWAKITAGNKWHPVSEDEALSFQSSAANPLPTMNIYALGCFVLSKKI